MGPGLRCVVATIERDLGIDSYAEQAGDDEYSRPRRHYRSCEHDTWLFATPEGTPERLIADHEERAGHDREPLPNRFHTAKHHKAEDEDLDRGRGHRGEGGAVAASEEQQ